MKSIFKTALILSIAILIPCQFLYADECDDLSALAKKALDSAWQAANEKDYEKAGDFYQEAAEYYDQIAGMKDSCRCPILRRESQSRADKYHGKADEYHEWVEKMNLENSLYEEYNRAAQICREGHSCARNRDYGAAIYKFSEAAAIWDEIGTHTESQYSKKAIKEANNARKAADYARKLLE